MGGWGEARLRVTFVRSLDDLQLNAGCYTKMRKRKLETSKGTEEKITK